MTDSDLDRSYSALANALAEVGQERALLLLSMLSLTLIARQDDAIEVLAVIDRARRQLTTDIPPVPGAAPRQ